MNLLILQGALVLAKSLKRSGTTRKTVIMITPEGVSDPMKYQLSTMFDEVVDVNALDSKDKINLALLERPELGITFTKLQCWNLTQYSKCIFLDADTLVSLCNCFKIYFYVISLTMTIFIITYSKFIGNEEL